MATWRDQNRQNRPNDSRSSRGRGSWRSQGRGSASAANPAGRRMENIASVSRSSGLQADGDALKSLKTQDEYREFIADKLNDFWKRYPHAGTGKASQQQSEVQENILILFRKLREGIVSSKRRDQFTLEVYETSLYLAILFHSPKQISSVVSHLIPELYSQVPGPQPHRTPSVLIALLHQLVLGSPSQNLYYSFLQAIPDHLLPRSSAAYLWLSSVASSLRMHNHCRFEQLTRSSSLSSFLDDVPSVPLDDRLAKLSLSSQSDRDLLKKALYSVVNELRAKARELAWTVIRSAYREISCHTGSPTRDWLEKSLTLHDVSSDTNTMTLNQWLQEKSSINHVRQKEGVEGRWIIYKAPR